MGNVLIAPMLSCCATKPNYPGLDANCGARFELLPDRFCGGISASKFQLPCTSPSGGIRRAF
jgi:hypothetical protein